jgi:hypothetical protein
MFRTLHAPGFLRGPARIAVIASTLVVVVIALPAVAAAATCDQRVLTDWSDNGRVDGIYPLRCYEQAIEALPVDLRDYTNAEEIIGRALTAALRTTPPVDASPAASEETEPAGDSGMPLALAGGVGVAGLVLVAGAIAYVARRRSAP